MSRFLRHCRLAILALELVLLHSLAIGGGQTSAAPPTQAGYRIAGKIVSSITGGPLPRARVSIFDAKNPQEQQFMITAEDGHFAFQVTAGKFSLQGAKRGFIAAAYDEHEEFSTAIVTGAGLDTEHLLLRLAPAAVLSGKILDESGEPVRRARVSLFSQDHRAGMDRIRRANQSFSDDQGSYEFTPLSPGTYFLSANATPWYAVHPASHQPDSANPPSFVDSSLDVAYPTVYYNDSTDPDGATPVPLRGGDHLQVDIHLSPVPALHLLFHVSDDGAHGFTMPRLARQTFDGADDFQAAGAQGISPGIFEITGVPAGKYTVRMPGPPGSESQMTEAEVDLTTDGQELDATGGQSAASIKASVHLLGEEPIPSQLFVGLRNSQMRVVAWQEVNAKGEVEFQNIAPGSYEVLADARQKAYAVIRISSSVSSTAGHTLNLAAGSSLTVTLSLVGGGVNVEGFAKRAGKAAPGAMVVLVPKNSDSNHELFRRDQSDLDGSFSLRSVIPGSYTVCAIENGWDLDWARPAVIASYCQHGQTLTFDSRPRSTIYLPAPVDVHPR